MVNVMSKIISNYRLNFLSIIIFCIIAFVAFFLTRDRLTLDINKLNTSISNFLATQENLDKQKMQSDFTNFTNKIIQIEKLSLNTQWLQDVFNKSLITSASANLGHFIVHNGKVYSQDNNIQYLSDIQNLNWYKKLIVNKDKYIYSEIYYDKNNNKIITIATQLASGTIVAINYYLEPNLHLLEDLNLPIGSSYYYFDNNNKLEKSKLIDTQNSVADEQLGNYVAQYLQQNILKKSPQGYTQIKYNGTDYFCFYRLNKDKWLSFVCIKYKTIYPTPWIFIVVLFVLAIYAVFTYLSYKREQKLSQENQFKQETINFLGNMYFFIIRVNFLQNTFKVIKATNEITKDIQDKDIQNYEQLVQYLSSHIESVACEEFIQFFSLNNINTLIKKQQDEYIGDFKADFNKQDHWISANLIIKNQLSKNEVIVCFRDIENEKQEQLAQIQLLQNTLEHAQQSEKAKQEFFAKMSHDMRTPLNAIMGNITLAKQLAKSPDDFITYLDKISISSDHLLELIDYILNVSRLENNKLQKQIEHVELKKCINTCVEPFYAIAKTQNKNFEVKFDLKNDYVLTNTFNLKQLLNNIISNSFKYSAANADITVSVKQLTFEQISKYEIIIKDTGFGISKKFLDKIFVPYSREARFRSSNVKGTGLGMNIVKNIVTSLNGEIYIDSEEGKGTTVSIILSLELDKNHQDTADNTVKQEQKIVDKIDLNSIKFLIVDDNEMNLDILEQILNMKHATCVRAYNGQEAVDIFNNSKTNEFHCILMDMQMPIMNGIEATEHIRSMDRLDAKSIPIIALTANAFAEDIMATSNAGMNGHIAKPINTNLLFKTIHDLISNEQNTK